MLTEQQKRNLSCHRKLYHLCHTRSFRLSFLLRYSDRQPADCRLWNSIPLDHYFLFCRNLLTDYFREIVTVYRPHNLQYDHTGTGAIINIILDPILIFGWFGLPRLEVVGAALATIIGQIIALTMSIFFNHTKNKEINLSMRHFRPHKRTISVIYKVGIPSIIMQSIGSVMTFGMNKILLMFSSTAAAVFGVYFKLQSFIFMPIFGLNNGMIPIIAYNYGARNKERIKQTATLSIIMAIGIMLVGLIIFQTCPRFLLATLFDASDHMLEIGVPALRIISLSFLFAGFCIIAGSVFQALGKWCLQPDRISCQTVTGNPSGSISVRKSFWTFYGMVVYSDRRDCFSYLVCRSFKTDLSVEG